jgi:hypothetical protein
MAGDAPAGWGTEVAARCHPEPEDLCRPAVTRPLLHVAYKPFTGRLHSPGEYLLYGCGASRGVLEGTVSSVFIMNYVQAHHLDLGFYDRFFQPGVYLRTHAEHMQRWHGEQQGG